MRPNSKRFSDYSDYSDRDVSPDNYYLHVESLDPEVVAFAPMLASSYPRVIAVGEGNGDLLRVTLLLPEECRAKRNNQQNKQVSQNQSTLRNGIILHKQLH